MTSCDCPGPCEDTRFQKARMATMPVAKSPTYNRSFKLHESYRSRLYKPTLEQARTAAGKPSTLMYPLYVRDPPLQHKRRVQTPLNQVVYTRDPLPNYPDSSAW